MVEQGRVRWKRFALAFTLVLTTTSLLVGATVQGAIGVTFVVSSSTFKLFAGEFRAQGFTLAVGIDRDIKGRLIPVLVTGVRRAEVFDLCTSAILKTPLGAVTLRITGGRGDEPVVATDLVIDAAAAQAAAFFNDIQLGRDASTLDAVPGARGPAGSFGAQSRTAVLRDARLTAWAATAGTFSLPDLALTLQVGDHPCF
ncbi:DUF6230 family protein [Streptosporangium sp. NBC_01639]|uniref:DUF6230 family protein n=1 Tax=Streptosporangium sp. NBC_01639 TaxID=2975948 RepID=UPI00386F3345|nr:DUF6230 family protein [Streptosporangium sp. NBC_01639]